MKINVFHDYSYILLINDDLDLDLAPFKKKEREEVPLLSTTMKSHIAPTGKNLCDKCGGSYATLAALISHKKSCKTSIIIG
ncbi:hypothetical protein DERF_002825 [Dermatophagoides farinae]|uniref:C2H2-type domain-containing protein n=1 Tax=Dermatophagoides farinae TaxID=6954 RepID=A0A922IDX2_DERFA|nr:hypothetical protein DERF_002825 [Dermatophagoides farinae]